MADDDIIEPVAAISRRYIALQPNDNPIYLTQRPITLDAGALAVPEWARVALAVGTFVATESVGAACMVYAVTGEGGPNGAPDDPGPIVQNVAIPSAEAIANIVRTEIRMEALRQLQVKINALHENMRFYLESLADEHKAAFLRETLIPDANRCKADAESLQPEGTAAYWLSIGLVQSILLEAMAQGVIQRPNWVQQTGVMETAFDRCVTSCRTSYLSRFNPRPQYPINTLSFLGRENAYYYELDGPRRWPADELIYMNRQLRFDIGNIDFRGGIALLGEGIWDFTVARGLTGRFVRVRSVATGRCLVPFGNCYYYHAGGDDVVLYMSEINGRVVFRDTHRFFMMQDTIGNRIVQGTPHEDQAEQFRLYRSGPGYKIRTASGGYWGVTNTTRLDVVNSASAYEYMIEDAHYRQAPVINSSDIVGSTPSHVKLPSHQKKRKQK